MKEIYTNTSEPLTLQIWYSQQVVPSSSTVTVQILKNDVIVGSGVVSAADANNVYSYLMPPALTAVDAEYTVVWSYSVQGVPMKKTEQLLVVTPYVRPERFTAEFPGLEGVPYESLKQLERTVRYVVNAYCKQSFNLQRNEWHTVQIGVGSHVYLPKRLVKLHSAYNGTALVTGSLAVNYLQQVITFPTLYGYVDVKADIGLPGSPTLFRQGDFVRLLGDWGWATIPGPVEHAASLLLAQYMEPESNWHRQRVEAVSSFDSRVQFAGDPSKTTGNVHVDQILSGYVALQPGVV